MPDTIVLTDGLGRDVQITLPVKRAVTMSPGATEVVSASGGFKRLVGVTNVDDYPEAVFDLPRYSVLPVDFERIVELQPDIAFASNQVNSPQDVKMFDALGIPVFYLDASSWTKVLDSIVQTGHILGTADQSERARDSLIVRQQQLVQLTKNVKNKPTSIFVVSHVTSYSFGQDSYVQDVLDWSGVTSLTTSFTAPAPVLSDEWVLTANPELIIGPFDPPVDAADFLERHPTWHLVQAIQSDSIVSISPNMISRPGPRNVEAAWQIARRVHPHLFSEKSEDEIAGKAASKAETGDVAANK